jgi:hypothetical protein
MRTSVMQSTISVLEEDEDCLQRTLVRAIYFELSDVDTNEEDIGKYLLML